LPSERAGRAGVSADADRAAEVGLVARLVRPGRARPPARSGWLRASSHAANRAAL
jgi:hypothetical protein